MHAARIETSERLQRTLAYLRACGESGATTAEIAEATDSQAVHSDAAELRVGGYGIECRYSGRTPSGRKVYRYRLVSGPIESESVR